MSREIKVDVLVRLTIEVEGDAKAVDVVNEELIILAESVTSQTEITNTEIVEIKEVVR